MTRPLALFLSPHLDDAVFSCGGLVARLAKAGWRVEIVTAFTASRLHPTGFALECQTEKGLAPDIDYMALRRAEDARACETLEATARWLDLPEAPHRGYASAGALFAGVRADDSAGAALDPILADLATMAPDLVLTAEGIGGHADHMVLRQAVEAEPGLATRLAYWRDEPYASQRDAPRAERAAAVDISSTLARKIAAARCYTTQLSFQFGGAEAVAPALSDAAGGPGPDAAEWVSGTTSWISEYGLAPDAAPARVKAARA